MISDVLMRRTLNGAGGNPALLVTLIVVFAAVMAEARVVPT
jgi:hypothetical protein